MNLEGLTLKLINDILNHELLGSKLYKIFMPNPRALLLSVRRMHDTSALICDLNNNSPVLYIPEKLPENPDTPPSFCMLLRKHLEDGRITKIFQSDLDRIITLEIDLLGASSKIITKKLIFELAGKNSNIILTQDDIIIDSLKHINAAQNSYRTIMPGKAYVAPPPQTGLNILTASPSQIVQKANALPAASFCKSLISATTGIGKVTALELLTAADILPQEVRLENAACLSLTKVIYDLQKHLNDTTTLHPVYALLSRTNQIKTILTLPPQNLEADMQVRKFNNINAAVNFAVNLRPTQLPQHEQLQKTVSSETAKLQRKLQALNQDLLCAEDAEQQRISADTIMANIYNLKKGQSQAELINIYDGKPITIALSPILSPVDNAQFYYKRYNKYKRAQSEIQLQIKAVQETLSYLASLDVSLLTAATKNEIEEIRQEMINNGLLKSTSKKKKNTRLQKSQPLHIKLNTETDIYIGKNNKQNDYVTFTIGSPKDLWFHTKDIPGSHVILKTVLPTPYPEDINLAVQLAAYFSKARNGSQIPVDCTERRYVKKPSGSKPGFVIFSNQNTFYTTPDITKITKIIEDL